MSLTIKVKMIWKQKKVYILSFINEWPYDRNKIIFIYHWSKTVLIQSKIKYNIIKSSYIKNVQHHVKVIKKIRLCQNDWNEIARDTSRKW